MPSPDRELVIDWRTRRLRPALNDAPIHTSRPLGWEGLSLEHYRVASVETDEISPLKHSVTLLLHGTMTVEWREDGKLTTHTLVPGNVSVVPAQVVHSCRSGDAGEFVSLLIDPRFMLLHCPEPVTVSEPRLRSRLGVTDPFMAGVCQTLLNEARTGAPGGRLYAETLATGLAMHLAGNFSTRPLPAARESRAPARREIRHAIAYIHEHLERDFTLTDLALAVNLSPFHFSRVFKKATGISPHQFVLRQRVQRAKELLLHGADSIAAVAVRVGFCDQSHFSAHFKKVCGVTPKQFADRHGRGPVVCG